MLTKQRPRGYLLIDVMIGGVLVAIVLATILSVVLHARSRNVYAARDVVATQLVLERLDQVRSQAFGAIAAGTTTEATVAGITSGRYSRTTVITTGNTNGGGFTLDFKEIRVTVTYTTQDSGVRTSQATTRVYR